MPLEMLASAGKSWPSISGWLATGVIAKGPKDKGRSTSLQQVAEAFASASKEVEAEQTKGGEWLWRGVCGRTSSLAPFGQRAAVAGLKRRPRLLCGEEVGYYFCRRADAASQGKKEEVAEGWQRRGPPLWRRWRRESPNVAQSLASEATVEAGLGGAGHGADAE